VLQPYIKYFWYKSKVTVKLNHGLLKILCLSIFHWKYRQLKSFFRNNKH